MPGTGLRLYRVPLRNQGGMIATVPLAYKKARPVRDELEMCPWCHPGEVGRPCPTRYQDTASWRLKPLTRGATSISDIPAL